MALRTHAPSRVQHAAARLAVGCCSLCTIEHRTQGPCSMLLKELACTSHCCCKQCSLLPGKRGSCLSPVSCLGPQPKVGHSLTAGHRESAHRSQNSGATHEQSNAWPAALLFCRGVAAPNLSSPLAALISADSAAVSVLQACNRLDNGCCTCLTCRAPCMATLERQSAPGPVFTTGMSDSPP